MFIPTSTYRIQFHKDFTFKDLHAILDYLEDLGVTTVYAAPILRARPTSIHGYDIVDFTQLNPEIGTLSEFRELIRSVKERNMTWVQDIVPNHMAFHTDNVILMDVLERGQHSQYHSFFDIDWYHADPSLYGKLQVPFLGKPLEECVRGQEISIDFSLYGFTVNYFDTSYPLSVSAYTVLKRYVPELEVEDIVNAVSTSREEWIQKRDAFIDSVSSNDLYLQCVLERLFYINSRPEILLEILENQYYILSYWKDTEARINYRRFFTVNELICLRMEDEKVFQEYHTFIHQLYRDGLIQGVRIDHIDGLQDPLQYVQRLRALLGADCYIIAEKILEAKESLPEGWPIEGTSGYEFLSYVSQLMTNRQGARELVTFYRDLVSGLPPYHTLVLRNKWLILENYMRGEWDNLLNLLLQIDGAEHFDRERIRMAMGWVMVSMPVYRVYPTAFPLNSSDRELLSECFVKAMNHGKDFQREIIFLKDGLLGDMDEQHNTEQWLRFIKRMMQFTGPLTAKGVEDTTFYVYNALISHDEVGDAPASLGISIHDFHQKIARRQIANPLSLNTTATHDTKRGEDARIRLNVLCDFPEQWQTLVREWMRENVVFKHKTSGGTLAPTINDEYYLYQSILGGFPEDFSVTDQFVDRVLAYQTKVVREAKVNSDWSNPDEMYEEACHRFIRSILSPGNLFLERLVSFLKEITPLANRYSLAQALIKITAPGIPDTYQGGALWDLSFVDPDNRRPVDYVKRYEFLSQLKHRSTHGGEDLFAYLEDHRAEGIEKLFVTWKALQFRKDNAALFTEGEYLPLQVKGDGAITVAYARVHRSKWVVVLAPLRVKSHRDQTDLQVDDELILPDSAPVAWKNVLTGEQMTSATGLRLSDCFNHFPMAMLEGEV